MKKRVISIAALLFAALMLVSGTLVQAEQRRLAEKLIRLHVVANSDSSRDQQIKLRVRDAVLEKTQALLDGAEAPRETLEANLDEIAQTAEDCLRSLGAETPVTVRLGKELFPTRTYETFALPAGVYESLRVRIGAGEGHNWWCVVFPSICLTASMDELELAAQTTGFTDGEIRLITEADEGFVLKFRAVELVQKLKNFLTGA